MITLLNGRGGLPEIHIQNEAAHCEISLMGAHLLSFIPAGRREVFFLSEKSEYSTTGAGREIVQVRAAPKGCLPVGAIHSLFPK